MSSPTFILVTGGFGFIGSHTVLSLLEKGYNVLIIDNFSNTSDINVQGLTSLHSKLLNGTILKNINIDIRNVEEMTKVFQEHTIDTIIHFAALKSVSESIINPLEYYENNVVGTLNLLKLVNRFKIPRFIFSSSATVYGSSIPPFDESSSNTGIGITNPYGMTKYMSEKIIEDMFKSKDCVTSFILLRYFNPIGAHYSGLIGEVPIGTPNNLFPYLLDVAEGKRKELQVFGNDYSTHDGTCLRDYIHVSDLAEGHCSALQFLETVPDKVCEVFNLGTGKGTSVLELIHTFEEVNNRTIFYIITERRPGDVKESFAKVEKAKELLNWEAKYNLKDMCKDGWNFRVKNKKI